MKAKVVIVEDNPVTVRSLVETIDWEQLDCAIMGTAGDGLSGMELIRRVQPDILLMDIRMPQMDGLEMLREIRSVIPECRVIVITGYDHFQYASQAIKLAVFDYILKPIRSGTVEEVVTRALQDLRSKQLQLDAVRRANRLTTQAQLLSLLMNESRSGQDIHQMLRDAGLYSDGYFIMLFASAGDQPLDYTAFDGTDALLASEGVRAVTLFLYDTLLVYLMVDGDASNWRQTALKTARMITSGERLPMNVSCSDLMQSHHRVRQAYQQARQAMWERVFCQYAPGECRIFHSQGDDRGEASLAQLQQRIDKLVRDCDLEEASIRSATDALCELSGRQYSNLRSLVSLYAMLLCKKYATYMPKSTYQEINASLFVSGQADVYQCLNRLCGALKSARDAQSGGGRSLMTRSALEYVTLHAAESLSLSAIADRLHVNANYLSFLIKRETGVPFHEHVLMAKMDIAYSLLADPRMRVADVAQAVGYSSYISFFNVFKRITHMTPTEYRNQMLPSLAPEDEPSGESGRI